MAETKTSISELTAATTVAASDLLFVSQLSGGAWNSKKATVGQLPFGQGTITGITMNGASKGTSGNVDLGTVLTGVPTSYKTYSDTKTQLETDGFKTYAAAKTQLSADGFKTYSDTKTQLGTDGYKTYSDTKTQLGTDGYKTYSDTKTQLSTDGFKTYSDTKTALDSVYKPLQTAKTDPTASGSTTSFIDTITQDANGIITATKKNVSFSGYKPTQTAKSSPTASGNATQFIDTISQDANGVITATKKTVLSASTSAAGIVQLNNTLTSTSTTQAATANAVKAAYDGCLKKNVDGQMMTGVKALHFKSSLAFPDDSYTADTLINNINFYDSALYNLANLNTRQTKAGNAMLQLSMKAPFGDNSADIYSYLRLYIRKDGKYAYATVPTPSSNSNDDAVSTTEWVNTKLSGYKTTQTAKTSPTASGSTTSFIDTISQDANGVITATKKTVQAASTSAAGIVKLVDSRVSASTTLAPTANALKATWDNCIHTSGTNQVINDCTTFRFDGQIDWTVGDSVVHTCNNIELRDVNDYVTGYLQTQRTAANNYVTYLACRAPTGTSGAASSATITIIVQPDNVKYITFPTPTVTSNGAVGATTEWVRSHINSAWTRVTVGRQNVLQNHAFNVLVLTENTTLYPPAELSEYGGRHFYLLAINTSNASRTVKFYKSVKNSTANDITYYMDNGYTPVTSFSNSTYFYEFYETSQNIFYVKQTKIVDKTSTIGQSA